MNLEDSEDEDEGETDDEEDEDETPKKGKPNPLVVSRWKMILPKKGEVHIFTTKNIILICSESWLFLQFQFPQVPKTGVKKLCETVLMKEL